MADLLTAAQMRAVETAAMNSGEVSGLELMERAGTGVVEAVFRHWPELARRAHRAVVLCGPGNNGGDGFVIARLLVARASLGVQAAGVGDAAPRPDSLAVPVVDTPLIRQAGGAAPQTAIMETYSSSGGLSGGGQ